MSENTRLLSLDVFRGMTVAGMVLVNNPGSWETIYPPLEHAEWNGWTPTDFVFPFFVFIVGVSITLALGKRVENGGVNRDMYFKILRRTVVIFLIGTFFATFPFYNFTKETWIDPAHIRILGVLQRIALCYFFSSIIFLHTNWKQQALIAVALLLIYWALMTLINVPGCEITTFNDKSCNLAAYLDRLILGEGHIWRGGVVYDPEGLLSTIPAISTCLAGVLTGQWIRQKRDDYEKVSALFFFGVMFVVLGWIWNFWFPINKSLWTSSYVFFMAGLALCFLGFCYWLVDIKGYKAWAKPFIIFGANALALYVGSDLMAVLLEKIKLHDAQGESISLGGFIYDNIFLPIAEPINASLLYAICFVLVWLFIMWLLYRKGIYIKI